MQFSIFSLLAIATVAWAAPQSNCNDGGFYYVDRDTLEPCQSACAGGACEIDSCPDDPILLCGAYCRC